jgi:putative aminopeptidase
MPCDWRIRVPKKARSMARLFAAAFWLPALPAARLPAQSLDSLTLRFAAFTAVSGFEQAVTDSLIMLLPGSKHDRAGNVTLTLGSGAPRRLVSCPLDEPGYVVGGVTDAGYLTLRRVGRVPGPLFDQQLEGQRVTLLGTHGAVPGVVGVRSTHLTRGRTANDAPFTVDNAYVDVGASSAAEVAALGLRILSPVALTKRPLVYGTDLVAAPAAARRAGCAAVARAILDHPKVRGTVVVAFTVQSLQDGNPGYQSVNHLQGPFADTLVATVTGKYPNTAAETVSFAEIRAVESRVIAWMRGGQ